MSVAESYLKPDVIRQIRRLDLRAKFIAKGFLHGLHSSPFHGFSVEFSEHRKYAPGDDPDDIDWLVYAKTDKYYVKKFEAETNITGYLLMDLSGSMDYAYGPHLSKFDYCLSLAAALAYLMIGQQDPVGMIAFDQAIRATMGPRSRRGHLAALLSRLVQLRARGETDFEKSLLQAAGALRHRSLLMIFSDLLAEPESILAGLRRLRHRGHDVIIFHVLDEAEVNFPFTGQVELEEPERNERLQVNADDLRNDYLEGLAEFRQGMQRECAQLAVDYVPLDTGMPFDRALMEFLLARRGRF